MANFFGTNFDDSLPVMAQTTIFLDGAVAIPCPVWAGQTLSSGETVTIAQRREW